MTHKQDVPLCVRTSHHREQMAKEAPSSGKGLRSYKDCRQGRTGREPGELGPS